MDHIDTKETGEAYKRLAAEEEAPAFVGTRTGVERFLTSPGDGIPGDHIAEARRGGGK